MNDMPPTEKQKKEVSGYIRKWRSILFLNQWHFNTHYFHEDHESFAAEIKMQTEYMTNDAAILGKPNLDTVLTVVSVIFFGLSLIWAILEELR